MSNLRTVTMVAGSNKPTGFGPEMFSFMSLRVSVLTALPADDVTLLSLSWSDLVGIVIHQLTE